MLSSFDSVRLGSLIFKTGVINHLFSWDLVVKILISPYWVTCEDWDWLNWNLNFSAQVIILLSLDADFLVGSLASRIEVHVDIDLHGEMLQRMLSGRLVLCMLKFGNFKISINFHICHKLRSFYY